MDVKKLLKKLQNYRFEVGPIRPPSEGGVYSLLLRFTCNCPWNMCRFCYGTPYRRKKFIYRNLDDIRRDVDSVKCMEETLKNISWGLGYNGNLNDDVLGYILNNLYDRGIIDNVIMVWKWIKVGKKTVFLQDADNMVMRTGDLVNVLNYLKSKFPSIKRITTYARAKSVFKKSLDELKEIHDAGLIRLHLGLESGDDETLKYVKKGINSKEHIISGIKAKEAGYEISEYIIPGLAGEQRSEQHAINTAKVLSEIDPDYVRSRPFIPRIGTPMYEEWMEGRFKLLSPHGLLKEMRLLVDKLNFSGRLCFDHMRNPSYRIDGGYVSLFSQSYEGYVFPEQKQTVLNLLDKGFSIPEKDFLKIEELIEFEKEIYRL